MPDFWRGSGYQLLAHEGGRLTVTDEYLRAYYARPELAPVAASCADERAIHAALIEQPRLVVDARKLAKIRDGDARENYAVVLRFRDQLLAAPSLEAFYTGLFQHDVAVPPLFIDQTVQAILRAILNDDGDGLKARAAEVFFRRQRVNVENGAIRLADDETVAMHASGGGLGNLGRLVREAQIPLRSIELDVLDANTRDEYWKRDERFDTVLQLNSTHAGCAALCRVIEAWIVHFHETPVTLTPVREIPDEDWVWHVGLDAESSAMLNEIYDGGDIGEERMRRIIGLYRLDFNNPSDMRAELAGKPVFLGLAATAEGHLRMKPQNLLMNLPLARRA
ncbi:MAG: hypothetical protein JWN94_1038 [Betaproteobacteria bacterium]|nr:hypothetical protein [Betaproteobacteria bacterium]